MLELITNTANWIWILPVAILIGVIFFIGYIKRIEDMDFNNMVKVSFAMIYLLQALAFFMPMIWLIDFILIDRTDEITDLVLFSFWIPFIATFTLLSYGIGPWMDSLLSKEKYIHKFSRDLNRGLK